MTPTRPRWHFLYIGLAALDLVTFAISFCIEAKYARTNVALRQLQSDVPAEQRVNSSRT